MTEDREPLESLFPSEAEAQQVLPFLIMLPGSSEFLHFPDSDDDDAATSLSYRLRRSRVFVKVKDFKNQRGELLIATAAIAEQKYSLAAWAALAVIVARRFRRLTDSQGKVLDELQRLSDGKPYTNSVSRQQLLQAFIDSSVDAARVIDELLGNDVLIADGDELRMTI